MGVAEGNSLYDKVIRRVRGICEAAHGARLHDLFIETDRPEHLCKERDTGRSRVNGIKSRLFVLLHVLIVGQRQPLHGSQKRHEIAVYTSGLAADKLTDIGILFLRHNAAAGRKGIIHLHKTVLVGIPDDEFFGEAAQVHHQDRESREKLQQIISVGDAVHGIPCRAVKIELVSHIGTVQRIGRTSERTGSQRALVHARAAVTYPQIISAEHLKVGVQVMGQRRGLCLLQVCKPGHKGLFVLFHQIQNDAEQVQDLSADPVRRLSGIQPHIQGNLVVAAPAGVQALARVADPVDEIRLDKAVNVLILC